MISHTLAAPGAQLEKLFTGTIWGEGPVWLPETASLRWSDIPNNRILEFSSATGQTRVHRESVEFTNGRTLDLNGAVLQCSHGRRAVERELDGTPVTLVERWEGVRFNSPNDIVVASDGAIWFTDPAYGIEEEGQGHTGVREYGGCWVFRFDEATGELTPVITEMEQPNGLAFSPDESVLYVSDTGEPHHILAWDVTWDAGAARCTNPRVFAVVSPGAPDGFRVDVEGRIWTSSGDSVQVFAPSGELVERILVPEVISNLCFGGDGHDLYITGATSLYRIRTTTRPAPRPERSAA
ncbi:MAG: gluconolactonase [Microbacteriaceae bacterium]|nr:gluconolactonase [Microbacteriaceae bacterium]